jgi:DNA (cytosine-5)-methyltransferase 1
MTYIEYINQILKPHTQPKYLAIDLYAGCGGMSLGFEAAGFETIGYEKNADACNTYNHNLTGKCFEADLNLHTQFPKVDIIIAGPPCQPFSVLGNQNGNDDSRNGFPVCISAIEQISPSVFVLENVKGLLGKSKWYLDYLFEQFQSLGYGYKVMLLNAKHYMVPQNRERVFIIGYKQKEIREVPSQNFLVTAGNALGEKIFEDNDNAKFLTPEMDAYIARYERASKCTTARDLHLDKPSRTLTCRNLAGSTGDMLRIKLENGKRRRLNINEAARLQSFPEWFEFKGNETSVFNQIGNAVPPMMAYHVAMAVKEILD